MTALSPAVATAMHSSRSRTSKALRLRRDGRLTVLAASDDGGCYRVRGDHDVYLVACDVEARRYSCTCPHVVGAGDPGDRCSHVLAVVSLRLDVEDARTAGPDPFAGLT